MRARNCLSCCLAPFQRGRHRSPFCHTNVVLAGLCDFFLYIKSHTELGLGKKKCKKCLLLLQLVQPCVPVTLSTPHSVTSRVFVWVCIKVYIKGYAAASYNQCVGVFELQPMGGVLCQCLFIWGNMSHYPSVCVCACVCVLSGV